MNKAILMGRLTKDPELRYTQSNTPVATFSIAIDRRFKNANGERETDFINCVAWRQQAEFLAKWFTKGRMIAVVGSIQTRRYVDKDGNNRTAVEVVADELSFCGDRSGEGGAPRDGGNSGGYRQQAQPHGGYERNTGDVPASQLPAGDFTDLDDGDDELPF